MKVGILGHGKMGRSIFGLFDDARTELAVWDLPEAVAEGRRRWEKRVQRDVRSGTITPADGERRLAQVTFTTDLAGLAGCDLVIEAVVEDFNTKVDLFRKVEQVVAADAVLASNTSSLSIAELGRSLQHPGRFGGYHFFHPVQFTSIVEIITWSGMAPQVTDVLRDASKTIGKTPIVVRDLPGSCMNAVLSFQTCESLYILEQGLALPSTIDRIASALGRVGPCETMDVVGLTLLDAATRRMFAHIPCGFQVPDLSARLLRDGRLGKVAKQGLYLYKDDRPFDDDVAYYRDPAQKHSYPTASASDEAIRERLLYSIFYSVLFMSHMGLGSMADLSMGMRDLIGMPFDPLARMRELGSQTVRDTLRRLYREIGPRFDPEPVADMLAQLG